MNEAFVYKWTHIPTLMWYIGYHKGDPHDGYICSGLEPREMIRQNPEEWKRDIIETGTHAAMYALETKLLQLSNAAADPLSFNKTNCGVNNPKLWSDPAHRAKMDTVNRTRIFSEETRLKMSEACRITSTGRPKSEATRKKLREINLGKPKSEAHKAALKEAWKTRAPDSPETRAKKIAAYAARRGIKCGPRPQNKCPHCLRMVDPSNMIRWHGVNCKQYGVV